MSAVKGSTHPAPAPLDLNSVYGRSIIGNDDPKTPSQAKSQDAAAEYNNPDNLGKSIDVKV